MIVLGAIIAGGLSRRFGGDKAASLFAGKTLIEHAIDALAPQVDALVIVGRTWGGYPSVDDYPFACGSLVNAIRTASCLNSSEYLKVPCCELYTLRRPAQNRHKSGMINGRALPSHTVCSFEFKPPLVRPTRLGIGSFSRSPAAVRCAFKCVATIIN